MKKKYSLFTLSEVRLLFYSEIFEQNSWQKKLFEINKKINLNDLHLFGLNEYEVASCVENKDIWLKGARKQWIECHIDIKSKPEKCDLCNQPHKKMCYVLNKVNDESLNIGGNCIQTLLGDEYSKINNRFDNIQTRKNLEQIQKQIPNIRSSVEKWDIFLESTSIIIPNSMSVEFKNIGTQLNELFNEAIKKVRNQKYINKLKVILEEGEVLKTKIIKYCKANENTPFVLNRIIYNEIKRLQPNNSNTIFEEILQNNSSIITYSVAHRIRSNTFLNEFINEFNKKNKNVKIISLVSSSFTIELKKFTDIFFKISAQEFILIFGDSVFGESKVTFEDKLRQLGNEIQPANSKSLDSINSLILKEMQKEITSFSLYKPKHDYQLNGIIHAEIKRIRSFNDSSYTRNIIWDKVDKLYEKKDIELLSKNILQLKEYYSVLENENMMAYFEFIENENKLFSDDGRNIIKGIRTMSPYEKNEKCTKELELLKEKIINFNVLNDDSVYFMFPNEKEISTIKKIEFFNKGLSIVLLNESNAVSSLILTIENKQKINREQLRKALLISSDSAEINR